MKKTTTITELDELSVTAPLKVYRRSSKKTLFVTELGTTSNSMSGMS